jgi:hypothetical protein
VKTPLLIDSEPVCENPLCSVRFPQTGLKIEPRRFCSNECRQQASIIRRAAKLFEGLSDSTVLEILKKHPAYNREVVKTSAAV